MEDPKPVAVEKSEDPRKNRWIYLLIIVPFFISGFITFALLRNNESKNVFPFGGNSRSTVISPTPNLDVAVNYPGEKIDPENERRYVREAFRKAEKTDSIDIGECLPIPQIAEFPLNSKITIMNSHTKAHTIRLSPTIAYTVPARGQLTIQANFDKGEGMYYYNCDDSSLPAGMFIVKNT